MRPSRPVVAALVGAVAVALVASWVALRGREDRPTTPDIVYVVLDRYAGETTLQQQYGFDNEPFLRSLEARGFTVARESLSPYQKTAHTMAASLNMAYLPDLVDVGAVEPGDWGPLYELLHGSRVARALQARGYEYVNIGNWWDPTAADPTADVNVPFGTESFDDREGIYRATPEQFDAIAIAPLRPGPTFVFAHVALPHPPYVFDRHGGYIPGEVELARSRRESYVEQLRYTNALVGRMVGRLLARPEDRRPVIVLQSDEGPHPFAYEGDPLFDWTTATDPELEEKFDILHAVHLPGSDAEVPQTLSPVNAFRLILGEYFGADLPLLPDRSFIFPDERRLYAFRDVTSRLRSP